MSDVAMITSLDEFEEEYRKGIGQPLAQRWTTAASLDNIRRWGDGAGDYNPLWRDPDYAAQQPLWDGDSAADVHLRGVAGGASGRGWGDRPGAPLDDALPDELRGRRDRLPPHDLAGRRAHGPGGGGADRAQAQRADWPLRDQHGAGAVLQPASGVGRLQEHAHGPLPKPGVGHDDRVRPRAPPRRRRRSGRPAGLGAHASRGGAALLGGRVGGGQAADPAQGHVQRVGVVPLHARRAGHVPHDAGGAGEGGVGRTRAAGAASTWSTRPSAATCPASSTTARSASAGWRRS